MCVCCLFGGQTLGLQVCLIGHRPQNRLRLLWLYGGQTHRLHLCLVGTVPSTGPCFVTGGLTCWAFHVVPGSREVPLMG